jgi:hypothetical protein
LKAVRNLTETVRNRTSASTTDRAAKDARAAASRDKGLNPVIAAKQQLALPAMSHWQPMPVSRVASFAGKNCSEATFELARS